MATVTIERRGPNLIPLALLIVVITAGLLIWATLQGGYTPPQAPVLAPPGVPPIELGEHAVEGHGSTALMTRKCLENQGPTHIFQERLSDTTRYHLLCQDKSTGKWYDMIVEKIEGAYQEITSFAVKDGTTDWQWVMKWLSRKNATFFRQPLP